MALVPIIEYPDPILRMKAKRVRKIDKSIERLAEDMIDTMQGANGLGLAANQVGVLRRVITIQLPEEEPRVYINPEIVHREGERLVEEGCLSVPGYRGFITRAVWIKVKALDLSTKLIRLKADEMLAQALEHEIDHLNGILYLDHLKSHEDLQKVEPEEEEEEEAASIEAVVG